MAKIINAKEQDSLVLVTTRAICHELSDRSEIPQIDISMLMPNYPGPAFPLFGVRISAKTSLKKDLKCTEFDILFRACSLAVFLEAVDLIRSREWQQEALLPSIISNPYPVRIVLEDQITRGFVCLERDTHIPAPGRRVINRELERTYYSNHCM